MATDAISNIIKWEYHCADEEKCKISMSLTTRLNSLSH